METVSIENIKLIKGGSISGNDLGSSTELPENTATEDIFGDADELWGNTLSPSDVNDSDFGFAIQYTGSNFPVLDYTTNYLELTNFGFSVPVGSTIDGVSVMVRHYWDSVAWEGYARVEYVEIKVYYTESTGTDANSERSLYLQGESSSNSERGLYLQGKLTNNSERGLYLEGYVSDFYTRESASDLESDDANLTTVFSEQEYTDVATDDDVFVDLEGNGVYQKFLFKEYNEDNNNTDNFVITWKGKTTLAPSDSSVYLQIYNRDTPSWETIDTESSANANTEFTLSGIKTTSLSDYYDESYVVDCRVYQEAT